MGPCISANRNIRLKTLNEHKESRRQSSKQRSLLILLTIAKRFIVVSVVLRYRKSHVMPYLKQTVIAWSCYMSDKNTVMCSFTL